MNSESMNYFAHREYKNKITKLIILAILSDKDAQKKLISGESVFDAIHVQNTIRDFFETETKNDKDAFEELKNHLAL